MDGNKAKRKVCGLREISFIRVWLSKAINLKRLRILLLVYSISPMFEVTTDSLLMLFTWFTDNINPFLVCKDGAYFIF